MRLMTVFVVQPGLIGFVSNKCLMALVASSVPRSKIDTFRIGILHLSSKVFQHFNIQMAELGLIATAVCSSVFIALEACSALSMRKNNLQQSWCELRSSWKLIPALVGILCPFVIQRLILEKAARLSGFLLSSVSLTVLSPNLGICN